MAKDHSLVLYRLIHHPTQPPARWWWGRECKPFGCTLGFSTPYLTTTSIMRRVSEDGVYHYFFLFGLQASGHKLGCMPGLDTKSTEDARTLVVVAAAGRAGENRTRPPGEPHQFGGASPADPVGTQGSHAEAPTPGRIGGTELPLPGLGKRKDVQGIRRSYS